MNSPIPNGTWHWGQFREAIQKTVNKLFCINPTSGTKRKQENGMKLQAINIQLKLPETFP